MVSMHQRKARIIRTYGLEPTICYYYYLWNVVDYCGEERVRESFQSIKGQGDEIIVGIYNTTDDTKKIAEKYGFRVIDVEKDEKQLFAESKIRNKVIFESKSNFIVALNINVEYPLDFTGYIKNWLKSNHTLVTALRFRNKIPPTNKYYGFSTVFYKPYLLYARGYDERTTYSGGSQQYGAKLLKQIFDVRAVGVDIGLIHKQHNQLKMPMMSKLFPDITYKKVRIIAKNKVNKLMNGLKENLSEGIKGVENSYW